MMEIFVKFQSIKSLQIVFAILSLLASVLAFVALFTPGWRSVSAEGGRVEIGHQENIQYSFQINVGLFGFLCNQDDLGSTQIYHGTLPNLCDDWADTQLPFETTVAILLIAGILLLLAAFLWDILILFTKLSEWQKGRWFLPALTSIGTLLLAIGFIVYWARGCAENDGLLPGWKNPTCKFGFSFILSGLSLLCAFLASIFGTILAVFNGRLGGGSGNLWS